MRFRFRAFWFVPLLAMLFWAFIIWFIVTAIHLT